MSGATAEAGIRLDKRPEPALSSPTVRVHNRVSLDFWQLGLAAADVIGSALLGSSLLLFHVGLAPYGPLTLWNGLITFGAAWLISSWVHELYRRSTLLSGLKTHLLKASKCAALAFGILLLFGFASKSLGGVSRLWMFAWALVVLAWVCLVRAAWSTHIQTLLKSGGCVERALVLAGSRRAADDAGRSLRDASNGYIGISATAGIPGTPGGTSIEWVERLVRQAMVDRVIIARFENAVGSTNHVLARLARLAVNVSLIPSMDGLEAPILSVDRIGILPSIDLAARPLTVFEAMLKRAEDLCLAILILTAMLPVLLIVSVAIKLDSRGPILFGQLREGYHNQVFRVWKFRTMYQEARDEAASRQTTRGDERITRVGAILRRLSLDELPQLFNVLRGEMSIVGPRPHALGMTTQGMRMPEVLEEYSARHRLKPGLTGWAQVNGCRGPVESVAKLRERVSLDCYYIDNWSLSLDAWIIIKTLALVVFDTDAY